MSKKAGNQEGDGGAADAGPLARLQRELVDRERQLRDLTEQSLGFLEELAEARRLNNDRERLAGRISELERSLTEARVRLQHAGGCVPARAKGGESPQAPPLAVVFWGEGSLAAARECLAVCGDVPVHWVGPPTAVPADMPTDAIRMLVHRDAHTPAQCWNLGVIGSDAEVVLLIGPGGRLATAPSLPATIAANVALLCPRIDRTDAAAVGCVERDALLRIVPRPIGSAESAPFAVPWADPRAFVVRRAAFERIGSFDEGLLGVASLLEYALRARLANLQVLGVPASAPAVVTTADLAALVEDLDRERLFVLAMHRPDQVGPALADLTDLWQLGTGEMVAFVAAVLARLPGGDPSVQRGVLDRLIAGMVQHALPAAQVCALVQTSRVALLRSCVDAKLVNGDELPTLLRRAESQVVTPADAAFAALAHDIVQCRNAAAATSRTLEATRAERRQFDAERHAQSDRAERADGARASVEKQLEQVQTWLREANAELKRVQEARQAAEVKATEAGQTAQRHAAELQRAQAERQQSEQSAQAERRQLESRLLATEQERARLAAQADEARAQARLADERLAAQLQSHRELEREFLEADRDRRNLHEHTAELARIVGLASGDDRGGLQDRMRSLHQEATRFADTLRSAGAADERALLENLERLALQLANSESTLRERERWIAVLLREVTSRRVFPRALQDHERAFLDRNGPQS